MDIPIHVIYISLDCERFDCTDGDRWDIIFYERQVVAVGFISSTKWWWRGAAEDLCRSRY